VAPKLLAWAAGGESSPPQRLHIVVGLHRLFDGRSRGQNRSWVVSSDQQHLAGDGMDWFTHLATVQVANALMAAAA
jgi:hypothetical protein